MVTEPANKRRRLPLSRVTQSWGCQLLQASDHVVQGMNDPATKLLCAELKSQHGLSCGTAECIARELVVLARKDAGGDVKRRNASTRQILRILREGDICSLPNIPDAPASPGALSVWIWEQCTRALHPAACVNKGVQPQFEPLVGCSRPGVFGIVPPNAGDADKICFIVKDLLLPHECELLLSHANMQGWSPASLEYSGEGAGESVVNWALRDSDRCVLDDEGLATVAWDRLKVLVPYHASFQPLSPVALNSCFRVLRYGMGQAGFAKHVDGRTVLGNNVSKLTVMLYLNSGFKGGATRLCHMDDAKDVDAGIDVVPQAGMALVFDHGIIHKGCPVHEGIKYAARTEVMYSSPDVPFSAHTAP